MGKFIVILLATCAAVGILVHLFGHHMATTAVVVPGTEHTPSFALTWTVIGALAVGGVFYKIVKGK